MWPVSLIGAASGWGAGFRETELGPEALHAYGLAEGLREAGIAADWTAMIEPERRWREAPEQLRETVFRLVAEHNARLAAQVAKEIGAGRFPVILGGDHSVAIGSWGGVARGRAGQKLGLVWFDAHLDAHTVATSPSMNPHGMSAAVLLGHGAPEFLAVGGGVVRPKNLCYIGARSYEAEELDLLRRLGVRIITMAEVHGRGLGAALDEAVAIAGRGTDAFGLTIDLDGFDPEDAPGVGLRTPDGLRRAEMLRVLAPLAGRADLAAVEIVEYIPSADEDQRTARLVEALLRTLLPRPPDRRTDGRHRAGRSAVAREGETETAGMAPLFSR
ncbi:MAG TPA: arginase [Stellaceae bacterium]|nr:arginase [Stellaceae bacterium]